MPTVQGVNSTIGPNSVASRVFSKSDQQAFKGLLMFFGAEPSSYSANCCAQVVVQTPPTRTGSRQPRIVSITTEAFFKTLESELGKWNGQTVLRSVRPARIRSRQAQITSRTFSRSSSMDERALDLGTRTVWDEFTTLLIRRAPRPSNNMARAALASRTLGSLRTPSGLSCL